jgi:hypothetical protein
MKQQPSGSNVCALPQPVRGARPALWSANDRLRRIGCTACRRALGDIDRPAGATSTRAVGSFAAISTLQGG